ncbi:hypothetical protein C2S52_015299 [Perilla frutescens var. hirtella]|nr:hypothetical protein C2S52_015299 [Perilla frutescens var. hirtella]
MKISQLFLCFILFSICTISFPSAAAPVVDIDGNPVLVGVDYYILPVIRGRGGGLTLASTGNKSCPLDVVQEPLEVNNGLPLTFRPANSSEGVVHVSADQNFIFSAASICVQSTVWVLYEEESTQTFFITTGGVEGNPGRETISNWFRVDEYEGDYKLVYCPGVCSICRVRCGDIGVLVQDGERRLALTDDAPFKVCSLCSLLLISIYIAAAAESPAAVLDILGKQLRVGTDYYILPVVRGRGGGLTLSTAAGNKSCPLDVVQERLEIKKGLPLTFQPANAKKGVVRVSTDHNIKFSASSTCVESTVWKLDYEESSQKYFITTGGVEGNPGRETLSNWFKIEEYGSDYKLVFCPTLCNYCKVICRDISIFVEDNGVRRRLGLNLTDAAPAPFKVMFMKAN